MDLHFSSRLCLFFFMITIHLVHFPTHVSAKDVQNLNCSAPFHCANLRNIGYPFWGSNRPEYCGYPGFELDCAGDVPKITIMDRAYKVLHINNESRRINVAREDYWDYNCPANLSNSSLNFSIFNYASDTRNLTLYYSCPASFMNNISGILLPNRFNCSIDGKNSNNYYFSWDSNSFNSSISSAIGAYFRSCANSVVIPVWQSTLRYMVNNLNSVNLTCALRVGFGLQWHANNRLCEECEQSNGNCGYIAKTGEFICYCPNGAYSSSCHSRTGMSYCIGISKLLVSDSFFVAVVSLAHEIRTLCNKLFYCTVKTDCWQTIIWNQNQNIHENREACVALSLSQLQQATAIFLIISLLFFSLCNHIHVLSGFF